MATNEFLPFGIAGNANVMAQATYQALAARSSGFQSGVAQSDQVNKVLRQAAFMASMIAQFSGDQTGTNVMDNGDLAGTEAIFLAAVRAVALGVVNGGNFAAQPSLAAEIAARILGDNNEAQIRAQNDATEAAARYAADVAEAQARDAGITAETIARQQGDQSLLDRFANYPTYGMFGLGNGYQNLPSGVVIQWGTYVSTTGNRDFFAFPAAFPIQVLSIVANEADGQGWGNPASPTIVSTTRVNRPAFQLSTVVGPNGNNFRFGGGIAVNIIAIGN